MAAAEMWRCSVLVAAALCVPNTTMQLAYFRLFIFACMRFVAQLSSRRPLHWLRIRIHFTRLSTTNCFLYARNRARVYDAG